MTRLRTIDAAFEELKALDPNTAITKYRVRQLIITGEIPSRKVGTKYLFNLEDLLNYFQAAGEV